MSRAKLKNAPLKEVLFELWWELSQDQTTGSPIDKFYPIALGLFAKEIHSQFPQRVNIPKGPFKIIPRPEWQFWKGKKTWPVIQLGPGVMTLNDTDVNYSWQDNFRSNANLSIETLLKSYEVPPKPSGVKLQYINVFECDVYGAEKFVSEKLQTTLEKKYSPPGNIQTINLLQTFRQEDGSNLHIQINNGLDRNTKKHCVFLTITIDNRTPLPLSAVTEWLDRSHNLTSNTFVNMLDKEFYASLD